MMFNRQEVAAELAVELERGCYPRDLVAVVTRHADAAAAEYGHPAGYVIALELASVLLAEAAS